MAQSIFTKYLPVTNHKPSRVKAFNSAKSESVILELNSDHGDYIETHAKAAKLLAEKLGWSGHWIKGETPDGFVWVHVNGGGFYVSKAGE